MNTLLSGVAAFMLAVFVGAAAEADETKTCYDNAYDQDHDGYAVRGAPESNVSVGSRDLRCPGGYRDKADDCDDDDAAVHPRTHEIAFNRRDDNCNGLEDEPTFFYDAEGRGNRVDSIDVSFRINHPAIRNAARSHTLAITARPVRLATYGTYSDRDFTPWQITYSPDFTTGRITIDNLESGTVWAVRLWFRREGDAPEDIGPNGDLIGDDRGGSVDTGWYYTMTDGRAPSVHNRFRAVMRGLAEYAASQVGEVGYRGTLSKDGQRYAADENEKWCSEFYVWVTRPFVRRVRGTTPQDMIAFFAHHGELRTARDIPFASAGDYLAMDTDEDGDVNHSGMFLAHDSDAGIVWTLEGNSKGNEVRVNQREFGGRIQLGDGNVLRRWGHVGPSMWR